MKLIASLLLISSLSAFACPEIEFAKYNCEADGYSYQMGIGIQGTTVRIEAEGQTFTINLPYQNTDEIGLNSYSYCSQADVVTEETFGEMTATYKMSVVDGKIVTTGEEITFICDADDCEDFSNWKPMKVDAAETCTKL